MSCHMVDLFGKKTKLFIWDSVWFQTIGDQKRPAGEKIFSKYKQDGLPSRASSAKQKFQTMSL